VLLLGRAVESCKLIRSWLFRNSLNRFHGNYFTNCLILGYVQDCKSNDGERSIKMLILNRMLVLELLCNFSFSINICLQLMIIDLRISARLLKSILD